MKFCNRRKYEYTSCTDIKTCAHYVTEKDIQDCHGAKFVAQWKVLFHNKNISKFGEDVGHFYDDYKHYARATYSFMNPRD